MGTFEAKDQTQTWILPGWPLRHALLDQTSDHEANHEISSC